MTNIENSIIKVKESGDCIKEISKVLESNRNIQKILKVTFQLKLQVFLLGINPENINESITIY